MPTPKKEQLVQEISEKLSRSSIAILTDARGLTVSQISQVRSELRTAGVDYHVAKNSLVKIAAQQQGMSNLDLDTIFSGPTAIAFAYTDETSPAKALKKLVEGLEHLEIKGALYNQGYLSREQVESLALLPSKEVLLGKFVGMLNSPLYGLLNIAQAKQREFLYALKAIAEQNQHNIIFL